MKNSAIEWTDHTFNPWSGCTKVSPGCAHCYAERLAKRAPKTLGGWGAGVPRRRTSEDYWRGPVKWNREAEALFNDPGVGDMCRKPRVFCASLADWLDDEVPVEWLADLLDLIRRTPMLDWLLLTKRPQLWRERIGMVDTHLALTEPNGTSSRPSERLQWVRDWYDGTAPANVWIGTTVEDQTRADERIPALLRIPARVRFLSCEPLLGPVDLTAVKQEVAPGFFGDCLQWYHRGYSHELAGTQYPSIHWVICGGESGHGARPMHPDWARSLRDQCQAAGMAFFFKQWGEWLPDNQRNFTVELGKHEFGILNPDGSRVNHRCGYTPPAAGLLRVGKATAGRLLDGREWNELPGGAT